MTASRALPNAPAPAPSRQAFSNRQRLLMAVAILLVGGVLLLGAGLVAGESPADFPLTARSIAAILYLAIPGSSLAWWIYLYLNEHWGSTRVSTTVFFTPGLAVVFGWLVLDETLSAWVVLGTAVLLIGIGVFRRGRRPVQA